MKRWALSLLAGLFTVTAAQAQIFTWTAAGDKTGNSDFASMIWCKSFSVADMVSAANQLKARRSGMRCLFLWCDLHAVLNDPRDKLSAKYFSMWFPHGTADALAKNKALIAQLKAAGVVPDQVILDNEDIRGTYTLSPDNIAALAADPRGAALGIVPIKAWDEAATLRFNNISGNASYAAMWTGIFEPFHAYAPSAPLSQFASGMGTPAEGQLVPDRWNHAGYGDTMLGTVASPAFYGGACLNPLTQKPYTQVLLAANQMRIAMRHSPVWPWYGPESMDTQWAGTGYWGEMIRQGFMICGLHGLLFDAPDASGASKLAVVYDDTKQAVGGKMPTTLYSTEIIDNAANFIVTARGDIGSGGKPTRIVGRVTFGPGVSTATFNVAGQSFTVAPASGQPGAWFSWSSGGSGSATQAAAAATSIAPATKASSKPALPPATKPLKVIPRPVDHF